MNPRQFRAARKRLRLSVNQMADMLGVTHTHVRRMEMPEDLEAHRPVRPTTARLLQAYLDGYRPEDWPLD